MKNGWKNSKITLISGSTFFEARGGSSWRGKLHGRRMGINVQILGKNTKIFLVYTVSYCKHLCILFETKQWHEVWEGEISFDRLKICKKIRPYDDKNLTEMTFLYSLETFSYEITFLKSIIQENIWKIAVTIESKCSFLGSLLRNDKW